MPNTNKHGMVSIGTTVKVGNHTIENVTSIGGIGGSRSTVDATNMNDKEEVKHGGVKQTGDFTVKFWYDKREETSDSTVLEGLEDAAEEVEIVVTMPDGATYSCYGEPSVSIDDIAVNGMISATLTVNRTSAWDKKRPGSQQ